MTRVLLIIAAAASLIAFPLLGEASAQTGGPPGIRAFTVETISPDVMENTTSTGKVMSTSFRYSARFLCGRIPNVTPENPSPQVYPLGPGTYVTSISIYNPANSAVAFTKSASSNAFAAQPGITGTPIGDVIGPRQSKDIDCSAIASLLGQPPFALSNPYFSGFVDISFTGTGSPFPFRVVGAYTACNLPGGEEGGCGGGNEGGGGSM